MIDSDNYFSRFYYSFRIDSVLRSLRSFIEQKVEESVDELFVAGKASDPLLVDQKGSLWDLIRNNLGNRFEGKLCNLIRIVEQE